MTAADVLEIIDRLDRAGIRWWIHGGWGLDALLVIPSRGGLPGSAVAEPCPTSASSIAAVPDPRYCPNCATALVRPHDESLKPACPACGWFRPTNALPVALVVAATASGKIVYTRQRGWPDGAWALVAGYVEVGETAEGAALRELLEETGLVGRNARLTRTLARDELVLICVEVDIEDVAPVAASDVEAVRLVPPDLDLTPADWPARAVIEDFIRKRATASQPARPGG